MKEYPFCIINFISYFSYLENSKFRVEVSILLLGLLTLKRFVFILKGSLNISQESHFVLL